MLINNNDMDIFICHRDKQFYDIINQFWMSRSIGHEPVNGYMRFLVSAARVLCTVLPCDMVTGDLAKPGGLGWDAKPNVLAGRPAALCKKQPCRGSELPVSVAPETLRYWVHLWQG